MNSIPRRIYLTFDDGPEGDFTLKVLDLLRDWGAKATFFVCGKNCEIFPHILKREVEEGHSIGNHTYSHNRLLVYLGLIKGEIERTRRIICELTGREVNLFRPPWGIMVPWLRWYLTRKGYRLVFWDIDTRDWSGIKGEEIARKVLREARDGAIVLFHDGDGKRSQRGRENTLQALRIILPELSARGYIFPPL